MPAQKLFRILCRNQIAIFLGVHHQVCKLVKLVESLFGQLYTMFRKELVQKILLRFVSSVTQVFSFLVSSMFGHCVSYILMLGHAGVQAPRRDTRYCMFAPSEPTCCTSEMSVNRFPAASSVCNCFTWNNCDYQVPN